MGIQLDNHFDMESGDPYAKVPAKWFMEIQAILEDCDVLDGHVERQPGQGGYGWQWIMDNAGGINRRLWDIFSLKDNSYAITQTNATNGGVWIAGAKVTSIGVDTGGFTAVAADTVTAAHWTTGTLTDATKQCAYLKINRDTPSVTLVADSEFPHATASTAHFPLWYIPYDTTNGKINYGNSQDMRDNYRWLAGA